MELSEESVCWGEKRHIDKPAAHESFRVSTVKRVLVLLPAESGGVLGALCVVIWYVVAGIAGIVGADLCGLGGSRMSRDGFGPCGRSAAWRFECAFICWCRCGLTVAV